MKPHSRAAAILTLLFSLFAPTAHATDTLVCDTSCGGVSQDDSTLIAARSSPSASRGTGTIINPVLHVPKSVAVVGSQSFTYGVPVFTFPGRAGMDMSLNLSYNSFIWTAGGFNNRQLVLNADFDQPSVGFRLDYGWLNFASDGSAGVLTDGSGAKHPIGLVPISPTQNGYRTTDGTDIRIQDGANGAKLALYKSGLVVTYTLINPSGFALSYRPILLEDSNGNTITITYQNNTSTSIKTITDPIGRNINFFYDASSLLSCVTTTSNCTTPSDLSPAGPSVALTYKFDWNPNYVLRFNFARSTGTLTSGTSTLRVLTGVTRPDGTSVRFDYGDWGIVNTVRELSANGTLRASVAYNYPAAADGALNDNPGYTQETVFDGVNTGNWLFNVTRDATTHAVTSFAMTDPAGVTNTATISSNGLPTQMATTGAACSPTPCTTPHSTTNSTWTFDKLFIPRLTKIVNLLEDDLTQASTEVGYDGDGNVADVKVYDYGTSAHGPLLKETIIAYQTTGNGTRPSDVQVKDGAGNLVFHRTMNYDEGTLTTQSPNPAGHDAAFSNAARGNLTSSTVYADPVAGTGAVVTKLTYDNLGNVLTQQDGCCTFTQNNYSASTQFAYPDSTVTGPPGKQLTAGSVTYNLGTGTVASFTDINNVVTHYSYDVDSRLQNIMTPDGVVTTENYDDNGAIPSSATSSTANSMVETTTFGPYGALDSSLSNGPLGGTSTTVSTQSNSYDAAGRLVSATNPYAPGQTPVVTIYGYDPLSRPMTVTPPAAAAGGTQNAYTTSYSLNTTTTTDPALKQRRQTIDALGRIVRVDEPGLLGGSAAGGSLTVAGAEKSVATSSGNGATAGTASVTITATAPPSDRSTVVKTNAATPARVTVTVGGGPNAKNSATICTGGPPSRFPLKCTTNTSPDTGTVQFSVNVNGTVIGPVKASYGNTSTPSLLATSLFQNFPANSFVTMSDPAGGATFTLTTVAKSSGANSTTVSASALTSCVDSDTVSCGGPAWTIAPAQANFTGGTDDVFTTFYDTGTIQVSFTANGTTYSESVPYGQNDTPLTLAPALAGKFNSDINANKVVTAGYQDNILKLTTLATGSTTNYPFSVTSSTTSPYFTGGSTSFPAAPSGSTFQPGANGLLYDSGTIRATLTGYTKAAFVETASFGQGSSAISVANSIAAAFHNDALSPVDASVASGTSTIAFTARTKGTEANAYSVTISESSNQSSSFPDPSFPTVAVTLANGAAPTPSLDPSVALSTTYTYDTTGNITRIVQGQQTRSYTYDGLGRLTSSSVPETGNQPATYNYTDFGAVHQKFDPRLIPGTSTHVTATYGYDDYNRLTSVTYNDGSPGITYGYGAPNAPNNAGGRLANVTSAPAAPNAGLSAREDYQYDVMGRQKQCLTTLQPIGSTLPPGTFTPAPATFTTGYSYYADGSLASITYPSGRVITNTVDAIGRLNHLDNNGAALLQIGTNYNAAGQVTSATFGNQVQVAYGYNNQMQLGSIRYTSAAGALLDLAYNYGGSQNNGQIVSITDNKTPAHSTSYAYDELKRLQTAQTSDMTAADSWKLRMSYDRYGNRLQQIKLDGNASVPDAVASVDPATNRLSLPGVTYDAAGNMTGDNLHTYTFDANNHVTKVDGANNGYSYGATGLRILKNGVYYVYAAGQVIAEYASGAASSPLAEYVYTGNRLLATIDSSGVTYHYPDHLSTRVSADASATVTRSFGHLPFGGTWYENGIVSKWKFTTYEHDSESNLEYAQARMQSAFFGRFTSADPLSGTATDPQSLNRYSYTTNDPVNQADPSGMAGGNWTCLLDNFGNCVGGNYNGAGLHATAGMGLWTSPFGPMTDPTKWDPLAEGEARYDEQVKAAFNDNNIERALIAAKKQLEGKKFLDGPGPNMMMAFADDNDKGEVPTPVPVDCDKDGKCTSYEVIQVYATPPPFNIKDDAPAQGTILPNGDVAVGPQGDFINCKDCKILRETSRTMTNPCTYISWTIAAAGVGLDLVPGAAEAAADTYLVRLVSVLSKRYLSPKSLAGRLAAGAGGTAAYFGFTPVKDAIKWGCDKMQ
jgi:RHS repeat-associated protein